MDIDFGAVKRVYFVGIKGVAQTSLAIYCKEKGFEVAGSDVKDEFPTKESLQKAGISVQEGFRPEHIMDAKPDLVIFTGAHEGCANVEVKTAERLNIPTYAHGKALGMIMDASQQVSVAGSHGKTTTSAMIATILSSAGQDPSWAIGCGAIKPLGLPGHFGRGKYFVAEADEYVTDPLHDLTPRFLWQHPSILTVTNIDYDHPDAYETIEAVQDAFVALQKQERGLATTVLNADDTKSAVLYGGNDVVSYGFSDNADYQVTDVLYGQGKTTFSMMIREMPVGTFTLRVPGKHNVANAAAAIATCHKLGLPFDRIQKGLSVFEGTKRRCELISQKDGVLVFDDYAHHPKEIQATLAGLKTWFPKSRIIAVFQPHTYSRTKALLHEFSQSFFDAGIVIVADIYSSAREHKTEGISAQGLVGEIATYTKQVYYQPDYQATAAFLRSLVARDDVVVFMGAGDIADWSGKFVKGLRI